ncbi:MAG: redoxin domain-containing protein [Bacteroidota bacterium]
MIKYVLYIAVVLSLLSGIAYLFWIQELQYALPTPKPDHLVETHRGDSVNLPTSVDLPSTAFIHFYNFNCPCSRFNIKEFRNMVHEFRDTEFVAVLQTDETDIASIDAFKRKYDLGIPVVLDNDGAIAKSLGVYSTPQAVIIKDGRIFYKGNYNKARFCTTRNTAFARLALTALMEGKEPPVFPEIATTAYGCSLPTNKNATQYHDFVTRTIRKWKTN